MIAAQLLMDAGGDMTMNWFGLFNRHSPKPGGLSDKHTLVYLMLDSAASQRAELERIVDQALQQLKGRLPNAEPSDKKYSPSVLQLMAEAADRSRPPSMGEPSYDAERLKMRALLLLEIRDDPMDLATQHLLDEIPALQEWIGQEVEAARNLVGWDDLNAELELLNALISSTSSDQQSIARFDSASSAIKARRNEIEALVESQLAAVRREAAGLQWRLGWPTWCRRVVLVVIAFGAWLVGERMPGDNWIVGGAVALATFVLVDWLLVGKLLEPRLNTIRRNVLRKTIRSVCDAHYDADRVLQAMMRSTA